MRNLLDRRGTAWTLGVVVPILMLLFDPAVFRSTRISLGTSILAPFKAGGYVGIAFAVAALIGVLLQERPRVLFAGIMAGAAVFGLTLGLALLPFSLLGAMVAGIGLLGLSPFPAAVVFGWWSRKVFRASVSKHRWLEGAAGFVLFCCVCVGFQLAASSVFRQSMDDIQSGRRRRVESGVARLALWSPVLDLDQVVQAWQNETNTQRKEALASAFQSVAGEPIEDRASRIAD